jgi:endoglucanase
MASLTLAILLPLLATAQLSPTTPFNPPPASSGTVPANGTSPNAQWSSLLGNALWFYEAQRAGEKVEGSRVEWRNSSVLDDGRDNGVDLSRGYFDAGDYSKQHFPLTWVSATIQMWSDGRRRDG